MADDRLNKFVEQALASGRSQHDVIAMLRKAHWPDDEINTALQAWLVTDGIPVPNRRPSIAAGDTFLYLLMFATFFMGAGGLLDVLFGFINSSVPPLDGYANYDIKYGVAALIVSFPVYAFLYAKTSRMALLDADHRSSPARRWLIYLTLLVSAIATITGVMSIVVGLLEGRGDTNGGLKLAVMVTLAALTFLNYLWELRRTAARPSSFRRTLIGLAILFIAGTIAAGGVYSIQHREPPPQYIRLEPGMRIIYPNDPTEERKNGNEPATKETPPSAE